MATYLSSEIALEAVVAAATDYVSIITDHDPDDGVHVVPGELRRFLARLRLLHGIPFSYLVPDADLLPIESPDGKKSKQAGSIRFFYIDRAWTDALVQGVLSVGTITTADRAQLEAVYPKIREEDGRSRTGDPPPDRRRTPAGAWGHDHRFPHAVSSRFRLAEPACTRLCARRDRGRRAHYRSGVPPGPTEGPPHGTPRPGRSARPD